MNTPPQHAAARPRRWVSLAGPVSTLIVFLTGALLFPSSFAGEPVEQALISLGVGSYAVAGALILWHRPGHAVGWILSLTAFVPMLGYLMQQVGDRLEGTASVVLGVASSLSWMSLFAGIITLLYVFPTGRLLSRRWRPAIGMLVVGVLATTLLDIHEHQASVAGLASERLVVVLEALSVGLLVPALLAVVSVVVRFLRAGQQERAQLRVVLAAAIVSGVGFALTPEEGVVAHVLHGLQFALLPIAISTAVIRHKLYDIDRAVKRTAIYAAATGMLLGLYAGVVLGAQSLFGADGRSDLVVAATTLLAAALFRPLASRLQAFVDRRFNRARYDAQLTVGAFGARLRDQVHLAELEDDLGEVVQRTVSPVHASLWLRPAAP